MPTPPILAARVVGLLLFVSLVLSLLKQAGLTRVAHWSWWAVTAPLWGSWALVAFLAVLAGLWAVAVDALRKPARP